LVKKGISSVLQSIFVVNKQKYDSKDNLIAGLRQMDSIAIQFIMSKTEHLILKNASKLGLSAQNAQDALHDGIVLLIEKIQNNTYDSTISAPQTYLVGLCNKILSNQSRGKKSINFEPLDVVIGLEDHELTAFIDLKGKIKLLHQLLEELGPPGNELIRLKYLEGYTDEEQMTQKLTPYNTHDSLRSARSQSMKKLAILAEKWKEIYHES
jgi:DNA-directed RNA polymerase specialized sigma24 family protein